MSNPLDTVPEGEPLTLVAGDTWVWQRSDLSSDYPLGLYTLNYSMQREGDTAAPMTFAAFEIGSIYKVIVAATTTVSKSAGNWRWVAYMVRSADAARVAIGSGLFVVKPDPAAAYDARSHAVKILAAIESLIEGRAASDVNSYSIAGRSLTKLSVDDLLRWRAYYKREVRRERDAANAAAGRPTGRTQVVSF
jgi:hypothetical protein